MNDQELHDEFTRCGREAWEAIERCKRLLPRIKARRIWAKKGYSSIYEYAARLAGLSQWQVNDALRIMKKLEDRPALKAVAEAKGLARVRPVVSVATPEDEGFWAEKAACMSRDTLQTYVREHKLQVKNGPRPKSKPEIELPTELSRRLEQASKRTDFEEKLSAFLDSLEEDTPEAVRTPSRHIPVKIKQHVLKRSGGKCAFPGCTKEHTSLHHTQRWALERVHDPKRLHALCTAHERLAHLGLIENEEQSPQNWKIRAQQDKMHPKFYVDQFVQFYRGKATSPP